MSLVTPDFGLIFWMTLIFGIVLFLLWKFGFPTITDMVEKRARRINDSLQKAAEVRAQEQLQSFAHTRPDGTSFTTAIDNAGHKFSSAGENLAAGSKPAGSRLPS